MTPEDRELIRTVSSDLRYLKEEWDESIDDDSLRRSSTTLRRLLVGEGTGDYSRAWRAVGLKREPSLQAVDLQPQIGPGLPPSTHFLAAGGGTNGMMQATQITHLNRALNPEEIAARFKAGSPTRWYGMREYLGSPDMVVVGTPISRRQIIQYVANKKGGAHLDHKRNAQGDITFTLLDKIGQGGVVLADKQVAYYELLSIGQAVARSPDAQHFITQANALLCTC